jgi:SAM-dependent methyltransferase
MDRSDWDARYGATDPDDLVWSAEPNRFLVTETEHLPPGRALDLACGEGRNAIWLARRGWAVTAIDFSAVALDKARRRAEALGVRVNWAVADVTAFTPAAAAFDLVTVLYLHLPADERRRALAHAAAAVAPGGTMLVVGHDVTNPEAGWGGPRDHAVLYGPDDVAHELPGLDVLRADRVDRHVATDEGDKIAIDALIRATRPTREGS